MSFLGAAFLWALPLAALPVIIHLLTRRRRQVLRWGAMQFLQEAVSRRRRIWRWEDWLLMALRTAAVLAMVLALARPLVRSHLFGSAGGRDVILVLDASLSTSRTMSTNGAARNGSVFDAMLRRADEFLEQLGESDDLRVLVASTAPRWLTPEPVAADPGNVARIKAQLRDLKPTLASVDMPRCLQEAAQAEGAINSRRVITVLTDQQAYGWRVGAAQAWQSVKQMMEAQSPPAVLNVVVVGDEASGLTNLSVESLAAGRGIAGPNEPVTLTAVVRNVGKWPSEPASLVWYSGGGGGEHAREYAGVAPGGATETHARESSGAAPGAESLGVTAVAALKPGEFTTASLVCSFPSPGIRSITCRLDRTDDLPLDGSDCVVVDVVEKVPVLVIDNSSRTDPLNTETGYLLAALGRPKGGEEEGWHSVFAPKVVDATEAAGLRFDDYRAIVCAGIGRLPDDFIRRITGFVHKGGGLWWVLGEESDAAFFNEKLFAGGKGLCPLGLGDPVGDAADHEKADLVNPPSADHPATRLLADTQRLDADRGRVYRHHRFQIDTQAAKVSVLLRSDGGDPLAVEQRIGQGRVLVQTVPMNVRWSNLPLCQAFVVMVHEWLWYLAEPAFGRWNLEPGQAFTLLLPGEASASPASVDVTTPAGTTDRIVPLVKDGGAVFRYAETLLPGGYAVVVKDAQGGEQTWPFHVRRDVRESDLTSLTVTDRQALGAGANARFVNDPLVDTPQGTRTPKVEPVWSLLLAAIVVLMLLELLLAGRMTRRRWVAAEPVAMGEARMVVPGSVVRTRKKEGSLVG